MGNVIEARRRILLNTPHIETASGGVANFKTDMIAPLKGCKVNFLPKQSGSGDPSPTNIRPISGWDGMTVTRCGKNLFNPSWLLMEGLTNTESETYGETRSYYNNPTGGRIPFSVQNGIQVTISLEAYVEPTAGDTGIGLALIAYRNDGATTNTQISIPNNTSIWTKFSMRPNSYFMVNGLRFLGSSNTHNITHIRNVQIELVTNTAYEPYTGSTFPVSWTQQGTVYGGYVDLVSGELVAEYTGYTFTGDETFYTTGSWIIARPSLVAARPYKGYCSHYPYAPYGHGKIGVMYNERNCTFDGNIYDQSGWKQFCKDQYDNGTPLTIVYMIKEPIHYSLTPTQIKTLKGINNVYSDADSAEVKFWTH